MNQITTESYHNLIRIFSFLMFQQTTKKTKLQKIKTTVIKNQWLSTMKYNIDLGIRHTEATSTHGDVINKNRKDGVNHKRLLYAKIKINIYQ